MAKRLYCSVAELHKNNFTHLNQLIEEVYMFLLYISLYLNSYSSLGCLIPLHLKLSRILN